MALDTFLRDCEGNMIFEGDELQWKDDVYKVGFGYYTYDDLEPQYGFFMVDEYNYIHTIPYSENHQLKLKNISRCD